MMGGTNVATVRQSLVSIVTSRRCFSVRCLCQGLGGVSPFLSMSAPRRVPGRYVYSALASTSFQKSTLVRTRKPLRLRLMFPSALMS